MVEFKEEKWTKAPKLVLWGGEYEGDGRAYVDPTTDARYPSVTSILKNTPKKDLMGWAAEKVAERARDRPDIVLGDPDKVVSRLQYAHTDYRDERGWIGTGVHAKIQADHEQTWDFPELDAEQLRMLDHFDEFSEAYKLKILHSEMTILNEDLGVMGTLDAVMETTDPITGEVSIDIGDWKTSRKLHVEHEMQLAALRGATHRFVEVTEHTEGASRRKGKTKAKDSWWLKEPVNWSADGYGAALVHLREDKYDFERIEEKKLHLREREYRVYAELAKLIQEAKREGWDGI